MKPTALLRVGSAIAYLVTTANVAVADVKIVAGSVCRHLNPSSLPVGADPWGSIYNGSSQTVQIICPIMRDEPYQDNFTDVEVRVTNDLSTSAHVTCAIQSANSTHSSIDFTGPLSFSGYNQSILDFSNVEDIDSFDGGSYAVHCSLGAGDSVFGIRWDE